MVDLLKLTAGTDIFSGQPDLVIFGGGKLALDAAKTCKDAGAEKITLLFREDLQNSPITDVDVKDSGLDGLDIIYNVGIQRLKGMANRLAELEYVDTQTRATAKFMMNYMIFSSGCTEKTNHYIDG